MPRRTLLIMLHLNACLAALGCGTDDFTDGPMMRQAQEWSGSTTRPSCGRTGPAGEALGSPDARYCEWTSLTATSGGTLSAIVRDGSTLVTWQRQLADSVDADRLTDSIRTALTARGLRERDCGALRNLSGESRGVRWEDAGFALDVTRITPHGGAPRIQVIASDVPAEMPSILCGRAAGGT